MSETPKTKTWKNLGARFVTAVIFALVCFVPFYFGGAAWTIFVVILGARLLWEWVKMTDETSGWPALAIPLIALIVAITYQYSGHMPWVLPTICVAAILALIERQRREGEKLWAPFGVVYLVLPCVAMIALRGDGIGLADHGFKLLGFIIMIVIAADVGAYFGGSYFQGPKIAPKLSPKKTWSGLFSGVISGAIMATVLSYGLNMGPPTAALIAIPIVIISVFGDFLESAIKRRMDVKDASDILPGHGGLLDRLDSLVLVVLFTMILVHTPVLNGLI